MILENNTQILWKKILITKHIRHWYWPQNSPYFIISVWVPRSTLAVWYILVREVRLWQLYTYKIHYWHRCIIKTMYRWIQELFFFFIYFSTSLLPLGFHSCMGLIYPSSSFSSWSFLISSLPLLSSYPPDLPWDQFSQRCAPLSASERMKPPCHHSHLHHLCEGDTRSNHKYK